MKYFLIIDVLQNCHPEVLEGRLYSIKQWIREPRLGYHDIFLNFATTLIKSMWVILIIFSLEFCTFGSTGNSLTDKKIIVTQLALLRASIKTSASLQFLFFDDRGDNALETFQLSSGTNSDIYTITLLDTSKFLLTSVDFYISTTSLSIENGIEIEFHTADSGSTAQAGTVTRMYSTAKNYSTSNFMKTNGLDENGSFSASENFSLTGLPQGMLKQVILRMGQTVLSGTIKNQTQSKPFTIEFSSMDISLAQLCSANLGLNQTINLKLDIQYSNLFKDTNSTTTIDNTKILRAINDLPIMNPTISATQNSGIYSEIIKNWNLTGTIKEHGCAK